MRRAKQSLLPRGEKVAEGRMRGSAGFGVPRRAPSL